uniref:Transmembrane protein n=1 Tax=Noccaea caerulescens TaxID=107243 RepID=A0A1J3ERA6_NOCCA
MACPRNSITYNATRCACGVGQLLNRSSGSCEIFGWPSTISSDKDVNYSGVSFAETIFAFDRIRKFTQSQAVFLEATLVMLLSWLLFCFFLRFTKLGDGRNVWFNLRWWITRLDVFFSTRHWLDDQQIVKKRKTELGGTFSVASWIVFIGLFAALLYQIITKRTIEVHNVRATGSPDLISFENDLEFNITAVSDMSCSNLRGIGNLVTGNPGFSDFKVASLSSFGNYTCSNTTSGPTVNFKCTKCRLTNDYIYISWHFVDLPDSPAAAVGFQFNFTCKNGANKRHISYVSGTLRNGSILDERPVTFRGTEGNILKFNLFPRIYHHLHDLKLIQPLFHEFIPGSVYRDTAQLQASLGRSSDGVLNTTLFINYLSAYIVEIDHENILGPVSFLADLGGLYCISIGIFFYLLVQCEYRIKNLRNEDTVFRRIRRRRKALDHWDKLRRYVAYTWDCSILVDDAIKTTKMSAICGLARPSASPNSSNKERGSPKTKMQHSNMSNKKPGLSIEKNVIPQPASLEMTSFDSASSLAHGDNISNEKSISQSSQSHPLCRSDDDMIPPPPPMEFSEGSSGSEVDAIDIKKKFQLLYDYNVLLREKLIDTQSLLNNLAAKASTSSTTEHGSA